MRFVMQPPVRTTPSAVRGGKAIYPFSSNAGDEFISAVVRVKIVKPHANTVVVVRRSWWIYWKLCLCRRVNATQHAELLTSSSRQLGCIDLLLNIVTRSSRWLCCDMVSNNKYSNCPFALVRETRCHQQYRPSIVPSN